MIIRFSSRVPKFIQKRNERDCVLASIFLSLQHMNLTQKQKKSSSCSGLHMSFLCSLLLNQGKTLYDPPYPSDNIIHTCTYDINISNLEKIIKIEKKSTQNTIRNIIYVHLYI